MDAQSPQAESRSSFHLPDSYRGEARETLKLAWPIVLTQLASMAIGTTDVIMVGRLGPEALAAVALGLSFFYMTVMFGFGLSGALSPLAAQAIGADPQGLNAQLRRPETTLALRLHFRHTFWTVTGVSVIMMAVLGLALPLFNLLTDDRALAAEAALYVYILAPSVPFMLAIGVFRNLFSALSRPVPALIVTFAWIAVNILLNWIFIYGNWGAPALGVAGSAIASTLSTIMGAVALGVIAALHPATRPLHPFADVFDIHWPHIKQVLRIGAPIGLTIAFEGGVFNAAVWLMGAYGTAQLAGHQIAINVASMTFQVPLGIAFATTVRVGYAAGAKNWAAARRAGHVGMGLAGFFMGLTAIAMWVLPYQIAGLYLDLSRPDALAAAAYGAQFLAIAALFQLFDGQQVAGTFALRGLKDTTVPMWINGIAYWGVGFPAAFALGRYAGLEGAGIWWGLAISLLVAAILMTWRFEIKTRPRRA